MWNWRRDRQPCSRHWSGDRNWSCYRRLNVEVPAIIHLHLTGETTSLFSSKLKCRSGADVAIRQSHLMNQVNYELLHLSNQSAKAWSIALRCFRYSAEL